MCNFCVLLFIVFIGALVGNLINIFKDYIPLMIRENWRLSCHNYTDNLNDISQEYHWVWKECILKCFHCKKGFPKWAILPFVRILIFRGICPRCKKSLSTVYTFIELLTSLLSIILVYRFGLSWIVLLQLVFIWGLILLAIIDFEYYLLPDCVTFSLLWLGLLSNAFGLYVPAYAAIFGAVVGYVSLLFVGAIFRYFRGIEGMGRGDFKLLSVLGAWGGLSPLVYIVFFASLIGTMFGIFQLLTRKNAQHMPIPFGSCLAFVGILMFYVRLF